MVNMATGQNREGTGAMTRKRSSSQRFTRSFPKFAEDDTDFMKN